MKDIDIDVGDQYWRGNIMVTTLISGPVFNNDFLHVHQRNAIISWGKDYGIWVQTV